MFENEARTSNSNHATMETEGLHNLLNEKLPCIRCRHMCSICYRSIVGSPESDTTTIKINTKSRTQSLSSYLNNAVCKASQSTPEPK